VDDGPKRCRNLTCAAAVLAASVSRMGSREAVMDALHDASGRFIALAGSLTAEEADLGVPPLSWTVAETIAHVLTVIRRGFADSRRSASPAETAELNQICLEEIEDRDPAALAALLRRDVHIALDLVYPRIPDDREFDFHGGVSTTMTPALHVVLGEFVIHGYDVARALGRPWPISDHEAMLLVPGDLIGAWLRPGAPDESYQLQLGSEPPISFAISSGRLLVSPGSSNGVSDSDVIHANPVELVLTFYGRRPTTDPTLTRLLSRFIPS
jgi:uncharacterized protein (TIGR03083 family)